MTILHARWCVVALSRCIQHVACKPTGACTAMNKILLCGGLSRATRCSGSPFLRTVVRYQSSEEVAQDGQAEDDGVEGGNSASTLPSNGPPLQQARGSSAYQGKGVAPSQRQHWHTETTQPQNGLNGEGHFSRSGRVAAARHAGNGTAVSATPRPRFAPIGVGVSPWSKVNEKVAPAAKRDDGSSPNVNGAGRPTPSVSRNVSSRLSNREQNNNTQTSRKGKAGNSWDILLNLERGGAGSTGGAQLRKPSVVDEGAAAAARRSDPLRPYPVPNGASILKVCMYSTYIWYVVCGLRVVFLSGTRGCWSSSTVILGDSILIRLFQHDPQLKSSHARRHPHLH